MESFCNSLSLALGFDFYRHQKNNETCFQVIDFDQNWRIVVEPLDSGEFKYYFFLEDHNEAKWGGVYPTQAEVIQQCCEDINETNEVCGDAARFQRLSQLQTMLSESGLIGKEEAPINGNCLIPQFFRALGTTEHLFQFIIELKPNHVGMLCFGVYGNQEFFGTVESEDDVLQILQTEIAREQSTIPDEGKN